MEIWNSHAKFPLCLCFIILKLKVNKRGIASFSNKNKNNQQEIH